MKPSYPNTLTLPETNVAIVASAGAGGVPERRNPNCFRIRGMTTESRAIAMLIDGDNAQPDLIADILAAAAKYGNVTTRRIYGDWTTQQKSGWRSILTSNAIQPIQQFSNVPSKNSADIALVIDAMDLLHAGTVQGFCIVSSDSDFTRLATRIREQGLFVMAIGKKDTPEAFKNACDAFVNVEELGEHPDEEASKD